MVRPSLKSTLRVSSVTLTLSARGINISTAEIVMPCLKELLLVVAEQSLNAPKLCTNKSVIALQSKRIKPELYQLVVSLNVHMRRFITIPGVKEETIWTDS